MSKTIQSNVCPVCLEHYSEVQYPNILKCGHILCHQCTTRLTACPIDRQTFDKNEIVRVFNAAEEKTEREKVTEFIKTLYSQIEQIENLEAEIVQLNDYKNKLVKKRNKKIKNLEAQIVQLKDHKVKLVKKRNKQSEKFQAEIREMKAKLAEYEELFTQFSSLVQNRFDITGQFSNVSQETKTVWLKTSKSPF